VHQRLILKPNARDENRAPVVFQYDSGGDYLPWAVQLLQAAITGGQDAFAQVEPIDDEQKADDETTPRATRFAAPAPTAGRRVPGNLRKQQTMLNE
jgi:hypothetical protein